METLEQRVANLNVIPSVQEQIVAALAENGIVEENKLSAILPALQKSLEITKANDGTYNIALVANGKILRHTEDDDRPWTVSDFVHDYVFESNLPRGCTGTIPYEESFSLSPEDIQAVAAGTKIILPPKRGKTASKNAIPSMDGRAMSQNIDEIASGKKEVDMSK